MFNRRLKKAIHELDLQILCLEEKLSTFYLDYDNQDDYDKTVAKLKELIELRNKLSETKVNESITPQVVSGLIGIASIILVLKFEKTEVITSKAFGMAGKMFRG